MRLSGFILVLIPCQFLDRGRVRRPGRQPVEAPGYLKVGTAGLVGLTIFALASDVQAQPPKPTADVAAAAEPGPAGPVVPSDLVKIYKENCAFCHDTVARLPGPI